MSGMSIAIQVLAVLVVGIIALVAVIAWRTLRFRPATSPRCDPLELAPDLIGAGKLARAVQIRTVSDIDRSKMDMEAFRGYALLLEEMFPLVHSQCGKTIVNDFSLVFHWRTTKPAPSGKPILITAHSDVVPVEPGTEIAWTHDAFSGDIADGRVWGRGTLDTKIHQIAALEAIERLLAAGFSPARDIYLAFGHDEEIGGAEGASKIVEYFRAMGLSFDFMIDEGGIVADGVLEGVRKPIALIGLGEKGFANIRFTVESDGGHSSMPSRHSSLGILAQALCRLESNPLKPRLIAPVRDFLMRIGPEMGLINRIVLSNLWLLKPLFLSVFSKSRVGGAMLRTTTAITMALGSPAPNIMPQRSVAVANFRILPGETGETLMAHLRNTLKGLPIEIVPLLLENPSRISPSECEGFRSIARQVHALYPEAIATPYLVMAGTDARKYESVCSDIYRFTPYRIHNDELGKIHGTNENITIDNVGRCIAFFQGLFQKI